MESTCIRGRSLGWLEAFLVIQRQTQLQSAAPALGLISGGIIKVQFRVDFFICVCVFSYFWEMGYFFYFWLISFCFFFHFGQIFMSTVNICKGLHWWQIKFTWTAELCLYLLIFCAWLLGQPSQYMTPWRLKRSDSVNLLTL